MTDNSKYFAIMMQSCIFTYKQETILDRVSEIHIISPCFSRSNMERSTVAHPPCFFVSLLICVTTAIRRSIRVSLSRARRHRQSPLEELALGVKNLAVDLRDGVRLARVAEMVGNTRGLMQVCVCDRVIV